MVFYARSGVNPPWRGGFGSLDASRIAAVRGWHYGAKLGMVARLNFAFYPFDTSIAPAGYKTVPSYSPEHKQARSRAHFLLVGLA